MCSTTCSTVTLSKNENFKTMRHLIISGLLLFFFCAANGQENKNTQENPVNYFNSFQSYLNINLNVDSAFYFVKKLASSAKYATLLQLLIHDSFAQEFIEKEAIDSSKIDSINQRIFFCNSILMAMVTDSTKLLSETARPLYLWAKIQDSKNDLQALTNLTNEFIKKELLSEDIYKNGLGRYALLIYQIISKHPKLNPLSEKLFAITYSNLKNNQVKTTDSSTTMDLRKRAWYRYLFAYTNYLKAKQTSDLNRKEIFLSLAFDYSPDLIDKNNYSAYFYDMIFLFNGEQKSTFKTDYLAFLTKNTTTNKKTILTSLLKVALIDPEYKNELQQFYKNNNTTGMSFEDYWMNAINSNAKTAPPISLSLSDKKLFSTKQLSGKWILVDFWGTWCAPCRVEHPAMQKFYDSVIVTNSKNISLLTIACSDTKEKVLAYMTEKHFTFPVAMSDNKIESIYSVQGYPTKVLITPEEKYVVVPFGIDWINFVKQYCDL